MMRAVGLFEHGGPEVLQVVDLPSVDAGPGQVRIRNYAAAVNPTDIVGRNGMRAEIQKKDVRKVNFYKRLMLNPRTKVMVA